MAFALRPSFLLRHTALLRRQISRPNKAIASFPARTLSTSSSLNRPTVTNAPANPDLLERVPNRPLPTLAEISSARRWIRTLPIFLAIVTASALCIFNYEKANSPIIAATLYSLRTNPRVRSELGDEVYFANKWAWIWGSINLMQGNVDVTFAVKGTKGRGMCRFRAKRFGGKSGIFQTQEWSLTMDDDGRVIQLLEGAGKDPLQSAGV